MNKKMNAAIQLQDQLGRLVHRERELLNEILDLIILADLSRTYLQLGHSSLFAWLTSYFKYSESAAKRRIDAARLKRAVPALEKKIGSGSVNLSTVSKVQSAIRAEEIRSKTKMTEAAKAQVVEKIEGKTGFETEKILMQEFPEAQIFQREKTKIVSAMEVSVSLVMTHEEHAFFLRAKELLSHVVPEGSPGKVVAALSREFVRRKDPLMKKADSEKTNSSTAVSKTKNSTTMDSETVNSKATRSREAMEKAGEISSPNVSSEQEVQVAGARSSQAHELNPRSSPTVSREESGSQIELVGLESFETQRAARSRHMPNAVRRAVTIRDQGACQFRDVSSGKICATRYKVEVDHIKPWALGGEHVIENLQCLCAQHNRFRAEQTFGVRKARGH